MIYLMIVVFLLGYISIAMEHTIKINKASVALLIGMLLWVIYIYLAPHIVQTVSAESFAEFLYHNDTVKLLPFKEQVRSFVVNQQLLETIGDVSETLLFLTGAMTVVEVIDVHGGFNFITNWIVTRKRRKLLWLVAIITFFLSAVLDNLTTTIVMVMLIRKIVKDTRERWIFCSMIVLAANSGGAWSPIGDITTIMLWVKGNITSLAIIKSIFLPSLVSLIVPLFIIQYSLKGKLPTSPNENYMEDQNSLNYYLTPLNRFIVFVSGISILILAPVFKAVTGLPPFVGVLLGVSILWIYTEIMYNQKKDMNESIKVRVSRIFQRLDISTLMFFLGILLAVDALSKAGVLVTLAEFMTMHLPNIYAQSISIGIMSSIFDNVPLLAGAMGMYPIVSESMLATLANPEYMQNFVVDGTFWHFIAYCVGTGGSILLIGSAAGVILMGLERITFVWYLKRISLLALLGYLCGAGVYILQVMLLG
ncbi:MAG: sodium:proton antiporter NhaD [Candidatus Saccharimonadaceae bacterium]